MSNKLWVFDTVQYLEIHAETKEEALSQADKMSSHTGMDFQLHHEWEIYQEEFENEHQGR
jgi:hypothetical protein